MTAHSFGVLNDRRICHSARESSDCHSLSFSDHRERLPFCCAFSLQAKTEKQKFSVLILLRRFFLLRAKAQCASALCSRLNVPFSSFLQGIIKVNFASALASCVSWRRLPFGLRCSASAKTASTLCPRFVVGSVFSLQAKTEKQKFSVFRFPFSV